MKAIETERRDWVIIAFILLSGLLCILLAGRWALRFTPRWELDANAESLLDPNSDFLTNKPGGFIEPVDPAILTNPAWINGFLTPGASLSSGTQLPTTAGTSFTTPTSSTLVTTQMVSPTTVASATKTALVLASPTNALVYFPPPPTSTLKSNPVSTSTSIIASTSTPTSTSTATITATPTPTSTSTATPTSSSTPPATSASTSTNTPDPSEPDFGGPDGNAYNLPNGSSITLNLAGFSVDGDPAYDTLDFELEETSAAGKIRMGRVVIEVYDSTTGTWYTIYHWGDGNADMNASYNNGNSEPDGFPIDMSSLSGTPPLNTGIAIDIDTVVIAQGASIGDSITQIRITSQSASDCHIDALQMLR